MRTIKVLSCVAAACTLSLIYAQAGDSASAPLGEATRYTKLNGSVRFQDGKNGVEIINELSGLDPKQTYDLYLLRAGCPAKAPLNDAGIGKLKQAAKTAQKLGTIDSRGKANPPVKGLSVKSALSKGLLLSQGGEPIECADIAPPTFGGPPPPPKK